MGLQLVLAVLACVLVLVSNVRLLLAGARRPDLEFSWSVLFTSAQLAFSVVTIIAFARRKRSAVRLMVFFYVFLIAAAVVGEGTAWLLVGSTLPGGIFDTRFVETLAFAGPWMGYLVRAKRVSRTFVVP